MPGEQRLEVGRLEGGEEAQGAHGKRNHRRQRCILPEEAQRVQHGAVASERDTKVRNVCMQRPGCPVLPVLLLCRRGNRRLAHARVWSQWYVAVVRGNFVEEVQFVPLLVAA